MQVASMLILIPLVIGTCVSESLNAGFGISSSTVDNSESDYVVSLPDLTLQIDSDSRSFQLEAYKSTRNDEILQDGTANRLSQLNWASIGAPQFISTPDAYHNSTHIFHISPTGFTSYIQMMTNDQREVLTAKAQAKYNVNITVDQIVNFVISTFKCSLEMYDDNSTKHTLTGVVTDFRNFPLRMDFSLETPSIVAEMFTKLISQDKKNLQFICNMQSTGRNKITSILTISPDQLQEIGLNEMLFANNDYVFVTGDQMAMFSADMYNQLNIAEDFGMTENAFQYAFIDGLISQLASQDFALVDTDAVLTSISTYGFTVDADIKPYEIKQLLVSIMKVQQNGNSSRIVLDEDNYNQFINSQSVSGPPAPISVSASANYAKSNSDGILSSDDSLSDQLKALNVASLNEAKWKFDGEKVVPRSLNVARLSRSKFSQTLRFSRVRIQKAVVTFDQQLSIYSPQKPIEINPCAVNPCKNNGMCTKLIALTYSCACTSGWTGPICSDEANPCAVIPCQNSGACIKLNSTAYSCACTPGWTGPKCSDEANPCAVIPCKNSGTCVKLNSTAYSCACTPGWTGQICIDEANPCAVNPCQNNATCAKLSSTKYSCDCTLGWTGQNCNDEANPCAGNPCQNSGTCTKLTSTKYSCACTPGWIGRDCSIDATPYHDCAELMAAGFTTSGVYALKKMTVYCDMVTDGGGWTVFQRRQDGSVDFYRNWANYTLGFGNISGEFWLGNENLFALTGTRRYKLRVDLTDFFGNRAYAEFSNFTVGPLYDNYKLTSLGAYSGTAGDSLSYHVGMQFSTHDQNHDTWSGGNCALLYHGAWWYKGSYCCYSNLNGHYYEGPSLASDYGINWYNWYTNWRSLKFSEMKIKPNNA